MSTKDDSVTSNKGRRPYTQLRGERERERERERRERERERGGREVIISWYKQPLTALGKATMGTINRTIPQQTER